MNELRNLQATGLSTLGTALKEAFDLLNLYRLHSGIDNYGMVSCNLYEKFFEIDCNHCLLKINPFCSCRVEILFLYNQQWLFVLPMEANFLHKVEFRKR